MSRPRGRDHGTRSAAALVLSLLLLAAPRPLLAADEGPPSAFERWWRESFEVHGFATSKLYARSPSLNYAEEIAFSSWRNELDLELSFDLYRGRDLRIGAYSILRPVYDAVYEIQPSHWGSDVSGAHFDPATLGAGRARSASLGRKFSGDGACVEGEFCLGNADTGTLFSGVEEPSIIIDDFVFFGNLSAPFRPFGASSAAKPFDRVGGNASGSTYRSFLESPFRTESALTQLTAQILNTGFLTDEDLARNFAELFTAYGSRGLEASLTSELGQTSGSYINPFTGQPLPPIAGQLPAGLPLRTPLNQYAGALGDRGSLKGQAPFDLNRSENRLKFDCLDNAHPWCFVREAYLEIQYGSTLARIGRQQIVWGKTDAFRLQDTINPIDLGYHNIFPDLEERRIPSLSLDLIHAFGDVGPLQDFSVEFAWVFDEFRPLQFGQCGEPYAYTAACQGQADAGAHSLFNFALASVDQRDWSFENTEPGLRIEFRIPRPSIAFSLSAFYAHQDLPVAEFRNNYSFSNPNPAAMLFLQGLGAGSLVEVIRSGSLDPNSPWIQGFDPYARDAAGNPTGSLAAANQRLLEAWSRIFTDPDALGSCASTIGDEAALGRCANDVAVLALPWTAGEYVLKYPRVLTLGASADYQIPRSDTILRLEMAADLDRAINDTSEPDGVDSSPVFLASIGIDRPTYIPFLNPTRTAFLTFQTFFEHVIDYDDGRGYGDGMVVPETQIISTFLMQNYWRSDSLILTTLVAYDWNARATVMAPSFRWVVNQNLFFDIGVNFLLGGADHQHNIHRDLCRDGTLSSCIADPTTWNAGQWQALVKNFERTTRAPWWGRQSFADSFQEDRDEIWVGVTYQF
jgi:hypothetical protein